MRINVFEGARRITFLLQAILILVALSIGGFESPYIRLVYETNFPDQPFVLSPTQDCGYFDNAIEQIERKADDGSIINITLCYKASRFNNGNMLIPFKVDDDGMVSGNSAYSTDVKDYAKRRAAAFLLPAEAAHEYKKIWWEKRLKNIWGAIKIAVVGCLIVWAVSFSIGWITRGFLGIPWRQDSGPEKPDAQ